eukprot:COSAG01_NODE_4882_length_4653_cov_5.709550_4_plen_226_part_00
MLHVRGVGGHGGAYEDEVKLAELFGKHGAVHQVTIRHREDAHSGENTSWALVTMGSAEAGATDSECGFASVTACCDWDMPTSRAPVLSCPRCPRCEGKIAGTLSRGRHRAWGGGERHHAGSLQPGGRRARVRMYMYLLRRAASRVMHACDGRRPGHGQSFYRGHVIDRGHRTSQDAAQAQRARCTGRSGDGTAGSLPRPPCPSSAGDRWGAGRACEPRATVRARS